MRLGETNRRRKFDFGPMCGQRTPFGRARDREDTTVGTVASGVHQGHRVCNGPGCGMGVPKALNAVSCLTSL